MMIKQILFILLVASQCFGTVGVQELVYVDCASGVDQTGCGAIGSPCGGVTYAAQYLDGGVDAAHPDIMYIKGTCSVAGSTSYNAPTVYPRGNYCKFTTWPGNAQAFIDGGISPTGTVIGATAVRSNNITIDNLKINGEVVFRFSDNLLITNSDLLGGGTKDVVNLGAWQDLLFIEDCMDGLILNNKIHDADGPSSVGGVMVTYYGKSSGISTPTNFTFRNNSFYVTEGFAKASYGLFLKQNPFMVNVEYNFFHRLQGGIFTSNQPPNGDVISIHHNIFSSCGYAGDERGAVTLMSDVANVNIYNNSFANSVWPDIVNKWNEVTFGSWNNLTIGTLSFIYMAYGSTINGLAYYIDYNGYYDPGTPGWYDTALFTSFASWQSHLAGLSKANVTDANSVYTDPGFINMTGSFSSPTDFKRTSYPTNGRGGAYPSVMGAYITGNELIGYSSQGVGTKHLRLSTGECLRREDGSCWAW